VGNDAEALNLGGIGFMESLPPRTFIQDVSPPCLRRKVPHPRRGRLRGYNIHAGQFQSRYIKVLMIEDPRLKLVACLSVGNVE
jgi:hypothetical protein